MMFSERVNRLRDVLRDRGLEGIIINKPENFHYFSGFGGSTGYLLIGAKAGEQKLLVDGRYTNQASQEAPLCEVVESDLVNPLATVKQQVGNLDWQRVGVEGSFLSYVAFGAMQSALEGVDLQDIDVAPLRMIKDEKEIALIRQAAVIATKAFEETLAYIRPGVKEVDVAAELEYRMRKQGSLQPAFETIVASGVRSALPHGRASEKIIEAGDFVTIDFGAIYRGYCSDMTRTVVVGEATKKQHEVYNTVLKAQLAGIGASLPGKIGCEIDAVARKVIDDAGYGKYFGHGLGHSLGLEVHEAPRLSPLNTTLAFASGMLATVEPGIYIPDWGGVRIEDLLVIREGKPENLTIFTKELIELPL